VSIDTRQHDPCSGVGGQFDDAALRRLLHDLGIRSTVLLGREDLKRVTVAIARARSLPAQNSEATAARAPHAA
jgi:hypothetical protein